MSPLPLESDTCTVSVRRHHNHKHPLHANQDTPLHRRTFLHRLKISFSGRMPPVRKTSICLSKMPNSPLPFMASVAAATAAPTERPLLSGEPAVPQATDPPKNPPRSLPKELLPRQACWWPLPFDRAGGAPGTSSFDGHDPISPTRRTKLFPSLQANTVPSPAVRPLCRARSLPLLWHPCAPPLGGRGGP